MEKEYTSAAKFIKRGRKYYPENSNYQIDEAILYQEQGKKTQSEKIFDDLINRVAQQQYLVIYTAQYLIGKKLTSKAIKLYQTARKKSSDPNSYSLELANAYQIIKR